MRLVKEPEVYFIAETSIRWGELDRYLRDIGTLWYPEDEKEGSADGEVLMEIGGRMCYRSWEPYDPDKPLCTNPNVTKIRKGNKTYLGNVLKQKHGSILEHAQISMLFRDVSRIFTHEIVRHRAGVAISQESLRYVRLDSIPFFIPETLKENPKAQSLFLEYIQKMEELQKELANTYQINEITDFHRKKQLTSAFRRGAPMGLATSILVSGNIRAWRHIITMRTSEAAEEEIRLVIGKVAKILKKHYPHAFQDMSLNDKGEWVFENEKV